MVETFRSWFKRNGEKSLSEIREVFHPIGSPFSQFLVAVFGMIFGGFVFAMSIYQTTLSLGFGLLGLFSIEIFFLIILCHAVYRDEKSGKEC